MRGGLIGWIASGMWRGGFVLLSRGWCCGCCSCLPIRSGYPRIRWDGVFHEAVTIIMLLEFLLKT